MECKNYYNIVGIAPDATTDEVEKAYRTLARKYHPDINPDDEEAANRFQEITEAHLVLTNSEKRQKFDRLWRSWQTHQEQTETTEFEWQEWLVSPADNGRPSGDLSGVNLSKEAVPGSFSEFFEAVFRDPPATEKTDEPTTDESPVQPSPEKPKKQQFLQTIEITMEESFSGTTRLLKISEQQLKVKIPKGAKTGTRVRLRGKQIHRHKPAEAPSEDEQGDLVLEIELLPHPIFELMGDDLQADLPLNLYTAVLGGEATVPNLGKGKIKLKIPPETQPGRMFRLKGLGLPKIQQPDERDDLVLRVTVVLPDNLTPEEIALFEELADLRGL